MDGLGELLLLGCLSGALLSLMAVGFSLIYSVLRVIDFNHMDRLTVAAYTYLLFEDKTGPVPAAAAGVVAGGVMGVLTEFLLYRRIRSRGSTSVMIASLGLSVVTQAVLSLLFGSHLLVPMLEEQALDLAGFHVFPRELLLAGAVPLIVCTAWFVLFRTNYGVLLRAVAADSNRAVLFRVPVGLFTSATFGFAGALAGLAGVFVVVSGGIHPFAGFKYMIMAFAACTVAGLGSLGGAALAGVIMGVLVTLAEAFGSSLVAEGFALLVLCLVLAFKPEGLLRGRWRWTL